MGIKQLSKFLIKAKINTYASSGEGGEKIFSDGNKEFKFKEGEFEYRDRYFGFNSFIGQEVVWQKEKAIWAMNYYGEIISEIVPAKKNYQFLQEALKRITKDKPFRGPNNFKNDDFEYINKVDGMVEEFNGQEMIFYKKQQVYKLSYHGGLVTREYKHKWKFPVDENSKITGKRRPIHVSKNNFRGY